MQLDETLPYFAAGIMVLAGIAFYLALQVVKKMHKKLDK